MPQIMARNDSSVLKIREFLGLNENPDGDTTLKNGEMAELRNFRITKDNHLQIRPGTKTVCDLYTAVFGGGEESAPKKEETRVYGVWRGAVGEKERILTAYEGRILEVDTETMTVTARGLCAKAETTFFGFDEKVYLLNGEEYLFWDGSEDGAFSVVEGYVPLIQNATTPKGDGTLQETVNRLTGKRRVRFSPDGEAKTFQLPETEVDEVLSVTLLGRTQEFSFDLDKGTVTLSTAPANGTDTLEVLYRKGEGFRADVVKMRFAELFNGAQDTRVFLYGDGSNRTIYSGIRHDTGKPSAEYFPDLYEAAVGESNTPITALVRHYSRMMAFKPDSAWVIQYGTMTLEDGNLTAAFYVQPVNRILGNEAPGQARLLENNPLTVDVGGIYQWRSTSTSGYVTNTEQNAKRVSDRVARSIADFDAANLLTFNLKSCHEYWFLQDGKAVILNYAVDAWYCYDCLPFRFLLEEDETVYGFCDDGRMVHLSRNYRNDDGTAIACYAATGAMDFDRDWLMKYSPMIFVALQPENGARVTVTVETNRRSDYPEKLIAHSLATFSHLDFNHFSFNTNRKPQVKRVKMKVKKATFYRMIFKSDSASATATVIETDVLLRYAGNVK